MLILVQTYEQYFATIYTHTITWPTSHPIPLMPSITVAVPNPLPTNIVLMKMLPNKIPYLGTPYDYCKFFTPCPLMINTVLNYFMYPAYMQHPMRIDPCRTPHIFTSMDWMPKHSQSSCLDFDACWINALYQIERDTSSLWNVNGEICTFLTFCHLGIVVPDQNNHFSHQIYPLH